MQPSVFTNRLDFPNDTVTAVKVVDPRLCMESSRDFVALMGGQVIGYQTFQSSNQSSQTVQITANPPNAGIAVARLALKRFVFDIEIKGDNGTSEDEDPSTLIVSGEYAPRCLPITAVTASESWQIGNDTVTSSPLGQYWIAMMNYNNEWRDRNGVLSLAPAMLDQYQYYEQGTGGSRNPLDNYQDGSPYEVPRGAYIGMQVLTNPVGGETATLRLTVTEPLFQSPMVWKDPQHYSSLIGVESMTYSCSFINDLQRVMSLTKFQGTSGFDAGGITINSVNVNLVSAELTMTYITPSALMQIPRTLISSYYSTLMLPTQIPNAVPLGNDVQVTMTSTQVSSIPRRVYVFCKEALSATATFENELVIPNYQQTAYAADSFLPISRIGFPLTVQYGNETFLTTATPEIIFSIAKKNGYIFDANQFFGGQYLPGDPFGSTSGAGPGAPLALEFGIDIGLPGDQAPSLLLQQQLQISCRFFNNTGRELQAITLYTVIIQEGTLAILNGSVSHNIGVLSRSQIINARQSPHITYQSSTDVYGGSFFSKIKNALSSLNKFAKDNKLISRGLALSGDPRLKVASRVAQSFGYGGNRRSRMRGGNLDIDEIKSRLKSHRSEHKSERRSERRSERNRDEENYEYSE